MVESRKVGGIVTDAFLPLMRFFGFEEKTYYMRKDFALGQSFRAEMFEQIAIVNQEPRGKKDDDDIRVGE